MGWAMSMCMFVAANQLCIWSCLKVFLLFLSVLARSVFIKVKYVASVQEQTRQLLLYLWGIYFGSTEKVAYATCKESLSSISAARLEIRIKFES